MRIGVPKEIKEEEGRVGITPSVVKILSKNGHDIYIEKEAGKKSGFSDSEYGLAGAKIIKNPKDVWDCDMIVKVKEPQEHEFDLLKPKSILFTFLHLAACPELTKVLLKKKITGIDYATIQLSNGSLPILKPMSEIAGKIATQKGAQYLEKINGGKGILLDGASVLVLGGGNAGVSAARVALGMGAKVTIMEENANKDFKITTYMLNQCGPISTTRFRFIGFSKNGLEENIKKTDLLIGATLVPGDNTPKIVTREMVKSMGEGSVIVDISIDQGGCVETSRPTSHKKPTFKKYGVIHYCVTNMPAIAPRTATLALVEQTREYLHSLTNISFYDLVKYFHAEKNDSFLKGVNTFNGFITHEGLAKAMGVKCVPLSKLL